jgi:hypothetical protein
MPKREAPLSEWTPKSVIAEINRLRRDIIQSTDELWSELFNNTDLSSNAFDNYWRVKRTYFVEFETRLESLVTLMEHLTDDPALRLAASLHTQAARLAVAPHDTVWQRLARRFRLPDEETTADPDQLAEAHAAVIVERNNLATAGRQSGAAYDDLTRQILALEVAYHRVRARQIGAEDQIRERVAILEQVIARLRDTAAYPYLDRELKSFAKVS